MIGLEIKKIRRTGLIPALLAGGVFSAAFPVINLAVRTEMFTGRPGNPAAIVMDANWLTMAMANLCVIIIGACILYHIEHVNNGIQKMDALPVNPAVLFFDKGILLALILAVVFAIETTALYFCTWKWLDGGKQILVSLCKTMGYTYAYSLPSLVLMLLIACLLKNMWVSFGIGMIGMFAAQLFVQEKSMAYFPFLLPYGRLSKEENIMNLIRLMKIEIRKLKRSKIGLILLIPVLLVWISGIMNADMNFEMQAEGISPENNFFIQSFLGYVWFILPSSLVVITVLMTQTERGNNGILKMLSLPVSGAALCLSKFCTILLVMGMEVAFITAGYFPAAWIASRKWEYDFLIEPGYVLQIAALLFLISIPMAAIYWMLAILFHNTVAAVGVGLATVVPIVLAINTKAWFAYPMCYPMMLITSKMHELATNMGTFSIRLIPWIPIAIAATLAALTLSCTLFGRAERR